MLAFSNHTDRSVVWSDSARGPVLHVCVCVCVSESGKQVQIMIRAIHQHNSGQYFLLRYSCGS